MDITNTNHECVTVHGAIRHAKSPTEARSLEIDFKKMQKVGNGKTGTSCPVCNLSGSAQSMKKNECNLWLSSLSR